MQKLFSTTDVKAKNRFQQLRYFCDKSLVALDRTLLRDDSFSAVVTGAKLGELALVHMRTNDLRVASTPRTSRQLGNGKDVLFATFVQKGLLHLDRQDVCTSLNVGDFTLYDPSTPWVIEYRSDLRVLSVEIPRSRVECTLRSARRLAGLVARDTSPTTVLARSYIFNLARVQHQLSADAAGRMASIAADLLIASLAERMAMDTPKPLHGTLTVQRAKAYVEANLGRIDLDAPKVAAAAGVSLRYLQVLFQERGCRVTQWIWQRRLDDAARRLSDPGLLHLQLGEVAYSCGFTSQSHFSRRFRESYGMSPRDYRHASLHTSLAASNGSTSLVGVD